MAIIYSPYSGFQHDKHLVIKCKSSQTSFKLTQTSMNVTVSQPNSKASSVMSSGCFSAHLGCDRMEIHMHECAKDKSSKITQCSRTNMDQNLKGVFPTPCRKEHQEERRMFWFYKVESVLNPNKVASKCNCLHCLQVVSIHQTKKWQTTNGSINDVTFPCTFPNKTN